MLQVYKLDDTTLTLRINGTKVWDWTYPEGNRSQFFQEGITAGVVKSGENVFSFDSFGGEATFIQLSDIVIWWQAKT